MLIIYLLAETWYFSAFDLESKFSLLQLAARKSARHFYLGNDMIWETETNKQSYTTDDYW